MEENLRKIAEGPVAKKRRPSDLLISIKREVIVKPEVLSPVPIAHYSTKVTVFMCDLCQQDFSNRTKLNFHIRITHTDSKEDDANKSNCARPSGAQTESLRMASEGSVSNNTLSSPRTSPARVESCELTAPFLELEAPPEAATAEAMPISTADADSDIMQYDPFLSILAGTVPEPEPSTTVSEQVQQQKRQRKPKLKKPSRPERNVVEDLACPVCDFTTTNNSMYINHIEMHEGKKPWPCPICSWGFEAVEKLLEHSATLHASDPVFQCEACKNNFKTQRGLVIHQTRWGCNKS